MEQPTEFQQWIRSIPHADYADIRSRIMEACGVSRTTFAAWTRGDTRPDTDNMVTITVIAHRYNNSSPFGKLYATQDSEGETVVIIRQPKV